MFLKINNFKLNFLSLVFLTILPYFIYLFLECWKIYTYNKSYYFFFTLISFSYLIQSINSRNSYSHFFLSFFVFLGFWFKFTINSVYNFKLNKNYYAEGTGYFAFSNSEVDNVILISIVVIICFWIPNLILKINNKNEDKNSDFVLKITKFEQVIFYFIFISICVLNYNYKIYIKGFYNSEINNFIYLFFAFFYQVFGLIILSLILQSQLHYKEKYYLKIILSFIALLIFLFSNLSRNILIFLPFYLMIYEFYQDQNLKINFKIILYFFIFLLFSVLLILVVSSKRDLTFNNIKSNILNKNIYSEKILPIIKYRFVGIDGLMSVYSWEDKSFDLYFESWKINEKKNINSFYDKKNKSIYLLDSNLSQRNFITVPGIVGHSFYTGSIIFLFCVSLLISFFLILIENFIKNIFRYKFVTVITMFLIVYRVIHFGYNPRNSYMLIFAIIVTLLSIKIYEKYKKKYFKL